MSMRPEHPEAAARVDRDLLGAELQVLDLENAIANANRVIATSTPALEAAIHVRDDLARKAGRAPREILKLNLNA